MLLEELIMSGTDIRSVGSSADILDSFMIKKRPATEQAPVVKEQTDISPQDNVQVSEKKADPKTKTNLDLVDKKPEDFQVLALPNEAGDGVGKFKVDPTGKPVADSEGIKLFSPIF